MARGHAHTQMNLDSLLDTVTNMVGFLVIVLVVVQLNVALSPPPAAPPPGPAPTSAPSQLPALEARAAGLEKQAGQLALEIERARAALEAEPKRQKLTDEKESLESLLRRLDAAIAKLKASARAAQEELQRLAREIEGAQGQPPAKPPTQELASIRVFETYAPASGRPKPVWAGKERIAFVCRRGRVYRLDADGLNRAMIGAVAAVAGRAPAGGQLSPEQIVARVEAHLAANDTGDKFFRVRLSRIRHNGRAVTAQLWQPRSDTQGDAQDTVRSGKGEHADALAKRFSPQRHWIRYYVWADSFEVYLAARKLAEGRGFDVGWMPFPADFEIAIPLGAAGGEDTAGPG